MQDHQNLPHKFKIGCRTTRTYRTNLTFDAVYNSGAPYMQGLRKCTSFPEFRSLLSFESDLSLPIDGHETLADVARAVFFGPDENDVVLDLFFSSASVLYELVRLGSQDVLDSMKALIPRSCSNLYCIHNKTYDQMVLKGALHLTDYVTNVVKCSVIKALIPRSCSNLYCIQNKIKDQIVLKGALHLTDYVTKVTERLSDEDVEPKVVLEFVLHSE